MTIIMHPLTAVGGVPSYTADDYRHVVNPLVVPSDGSAFGGLQGVRAGFKEPLATLDGLTVTVEPHCGVVCPWEGGGVYTYAITVSETVQITDSTSNYKIAVVVDDPLQTDVQVPCGRVQAFPGSTPDSKIPGLVLALVSSGGISTVAPVLHSRMLVEVVDDRALESLSALDGQEALVASTGRRYVRENGVWHDTAEVSVFDWNNGLISFMYGATSCTVQVSNVMIAAGSWDSSVFGTKIRESYRPVVEVSAPLSVENGGSVTGLLVVAPDGTVSVRNMGSTGSGGKRRGSVTWPVSCRY